MTLNRETILAGIAGFALGLLAAWAVWSIPQITSKRQLPPFVQEAASPTPIGFTLTLTQPEDEAILETPEASVAGKTEAGATVVVAGPFGEEVVEATADGTFSTTVALEEGVNEIVITAYGKNDQEKTETRTVSYTKEEF
ncbi:hypothetical protein HY946_00015 [Candidatus Gottesmanbacteria bacterium]|nr:hypothetical protein [Candidatus Gottesmanbacteria bacterium]